MEFDEYMTVREICDVLRLDDKAVYGAIASGDLKASKLGKVWRIARSDVTAWIEACSNQRANKEGRP